MKIKNFFAIVLFATSACVKAKRTPEAPQTTSVTPVLTLSASTPAITLGASANLTWSTEGIKEDSCSLVASDGSTLPAFSAKSATVSPKTSTTYTATCTKAESGEAINETSSTSVSVNSSADSSVPPLTTSGVAVYVNGSTSTTIASGTSVSVTWQTNGVSDESSCTIVASPSGSENLVFSSKSANVVPTSTTTFTVTCPNASAGSPAYSASATVNVSSSTSPITNSGTCAGVQVGGYCWYLSAVDQSCDTVCTSRGATAVSYDSYAGSSGTDENCNATLQALGIASNDQLNSINCTSGWGCYANATGMGKNRCRNMAFVSNISSPIARLACACTF